MGIIVLLIMACYELISSRKYSGLYEIEYKTFKDGR